MDKPCIEIILVGHMALSGQSSQWQVAETGSDTCRRHNGYNSERP